MRISRFHAAVTSLFIVGAAGTLSAQNAAPNSAPAPAAVTSGSMIQFDNREYDFGRVPAGEMVKHVYTVKNIGTEMLEISNVHPGCGCTAAGAWTRSIAPGKTGTIPIQFNSTHYSSAVTKTIDVTSNAKNEPKATLILRGTVWKPVDITPSSAVISVQSDSTNDASTSVRIKIQADSDVTLSDVTSTSKTFTGELKAVTPGKEYELVVTAHPPFAPGNAPATLSIKTSLTNVPSVTVTAIASVQAAVQISPGIIALPPNIDRWMTNRVFIRGNGNFVLALQDAQSSDSRIETKIVPVVASRGMFNLMVAVPPGFQIPPGQHDTVTVKSNHPHYPLITIPINQLPRARGMAGQPPAPVLVKQSATNGPPQPHP